MIPLLPLLAFAVDLADVGIILPPISTAVRLFVLFQLVCLWLIKKNLGIGKRVVVVVEVVLHVRHHLLQLFRSHVNELESSFNKIVA